MKNHFARHATAALALAALTVPAALMAEDIGLIRPQARPLAETAATPEPAPAAPGTEARDSAGASLFPRRPASLGGPSGAAAAPVPEPTALADTIGDEPASADPAQPMAEPADITPPPAPQDEQVQVASLTTHIRPRARPEGLVLTPTEVAGGKCTDPATVRDRDVARNISAFAADPDLCITQETFTEHGRPWHLVIVTNKGRKRGPVWAALHDNEDSAFDAGLYSVSRYGGSMVAVEAGEQRSFKGQDPNRNFGKSANITGPCRDMSPKPSPKFTQAISKHFNRRFPVMTMHSNDNGYAGNGGSGHISAARSSATMRGFMSTNPKRGLSDEDNAILTAGLNPYESEAKAQRLVQHFSPLGINVIYEHVRPQKNDCSFSFHTLLNKMGDYYNIEVEHGRVEAQKAILDALMNYIGARPLY